MKKSILIALCASIWGPVALAQNADTAIDIRQKIEAIVTEASNTAPGIEDKLFAILPAPQGWTCKRQNNRKQNGQSGIAVIPNVSATCTHEITSMHIVIFLAEKMANTFCLQVDSTQRQIAEGRIKPDLFQFFINDTWKIQRASVDITGCAKNGVSFAAHGDRTKQGLVNGPAVINQFIEALVHSDPSSTLNEAEVSTQLERVKNLSDLLYKQSWNMAKIIPAPPDSVVKITQPIPQAIRDKTSLPPLLELGTAPAATAIITTKGCKVMVVLSAGPNSLYEAKNTGQRWGRKGGIDGHIDSAFIRRNTDRFVGREKVNGTGIEALVDDSVLVRIIIPGNKPCVNNPKIVRSLFDQIISRDLSVFKRPL